MVFGNESMNAGKDKQRAPAAAAVVSSPPVAVTPEKKEL